MAREKTAPRPSVSGGGRDSRGGASVQQTSQQGWGEAGGWQNQVREGREGRKKWGDDKEDGGR